MNENHQRHLLSTFQHVDNLLSEAERILATAGSSSPFQEYSQDSTPIQRKVTHDYILRTRKTMGRILEELNVPLKPPISGALWAARTHSSFASIAIAEIEPEPMSGYGSLSEVDNELLRKIVAELNVPLDRLNTYLGQGTDVDLQTRLQRLEQTRDEIKLLAELERIITTHGLIEFRASLALLLDRIEAPTFEIGVFGRVSSGKSSLLNHVLGGAFLPVGVTPVTAVPIRISFGSPAQAIIHFAEEKSKTIDLNRLAEFSAEQHNPGNAKHVAGIRVQIPAEQLREGMAFVDTPGVGSLATSGAAETAAYLPRCDLGVVLLDAGTSLTYEDLVLVQALYQAGASVMVLLSKADLLTSADRERTLGYIRDQLHTEVNLDLPVHLVSVAVGDTQLCDQWYEKALKPLLESSQQNVGSSLKRKIGGLREAVEQVLQQRTESPHRSRPPASDQAAKNALEALRTADAMIEMAMRESYRVADKIRSLDERMIKAVSEDILTAWNSAEAHPKEPGEIVATTLCREFSLQGTGCLDTVLNIRDRLMQTLHTVREASLLAYESDEMPKASGLPLIDPSPLVHLIVLKRPTLLRVFGRSALRRYVRRELSRQLVESLPSFLNNAGKSLEQWYRLALANLQKAFGANAEIYRLRLLQLQEAPTAEDADNGLQNDLAVLRKWIA